MTRNFILTPIRLKVIFLLAILTSIAWLPVTFPRLSVVDGKYSNDFILDAFLSFPVKLFNSPFCYYSNNMIRYHYSRSFYSNKNNYKEYFLLLHHHENLFSKISKSSEREEEGQRGREGEEEGKGGGKGRGETWEDRLIPGIEKKSMENILSKGKSATLRWLQKKIKIYRKPNNNKYSKIKKVDKRRQKREGGTEEKQKQKQKQKQGGGGENKLQEGKKKTDKKRWSPALNVKVFGIGDGGGNALIHLLKEGKITPFFRDAKAEKVTMEYWALNTDSSSLSRQREQIVNLHQPDIRYHDIHLGSSRKNLTLGFGTGGNLTSGLESIERCPLSQEQIVNASKGSDIIFLLAGLGGGTASGSLPSIGQVIRNKNHFIKNDNDDDNSPATQDYINAEVEAVTKASLRAQGKVKVKVKDPPLVIALVSLPYTFEGPTRLKQAVLSLGALRKEVDAIILVKNNEVLNPKSTPTSLYSTINTMFASSLLEILLKYNESRKEMPFDQTAFLSSMIISGQNLRPINQNIASSTTRTTSVTTTTTATARTNKTKDDDKLNLELRTYNSLPLLNLRRASNRPMNQFHHLSNYKFNEKYEEFMTLSDFSLNNHYLDDPFLLHKVKASQRKRKRSPKEIQRFERFARFRKENSKYFLPSPMHAIKIKNTKTKNEKEIEESNPKNMGKHDEHEQSPTESIPAWNFFYFEKSTKSQSEILLYWIIQSSSNLIVLPPPPSSSSSSSSSSFPSSFPSCSSSSASAYLSLTLSSSLSVSSSIPSSIPSSLEPLSILRYPKSKFLRPLHQQAEPSTPYIPSFLIDTGSEIVGGKTETRGGNNNNSSKDKTKNKRRLKDLYKVKASTSARRKRHLRRINKRKNNNNNNNNSLLNNEAEDINEQKEDIKLYLYYNLAFKNKNRERYGN